MPLKTWVEYERLEAADLNSAYAWSQELTLPGAYSGVQGTMTGSIASPNWAEVRHGAPVAANDPLGIYRASDGRLVVPSTAIWFWRATFHSEAATTTGDQSQVALNVDGVRINLGQVIRRTANTMQTQLVYVAPLTVGQVLFVEGRALSSALIAAINGWSMIRIGRAFGLPGAVGTMQSGPGV